MDMTEGIHSMRVYPMGELPAEVRHAVPSARLDAPSPEWATATLLLEVCRRQKGWYGVELGTLRDILQGEVRRQAHPAALNAALVRGLTTLVDRDMLSRERVGPWEVYFPKSSLLLL